MPEDIILRYCSPTLAGMKTASLFSCPCSSAEDLRKDIREINHLLVPKGLRAIPLRLEKERALIYIYRTSQLKRDLSDNAVRDILSSYGYTCENPEKCLAKLIVKLHNSGEFPHEIGLFLGYPPEDVRGFIENKAASSKLSGYWKVYGDEQKAKRLFEKYKKCTDVYCAQWKKGRPMEKLTVAG